MLRRSSTCLVGLTLSTLAGCDDTTVMRIADLEDGSYVRGEQVATLEISADVRSQRAELFLDGQRIAADDFAPFELAWNTEQFEDGEHALLARIYLDDARRADATVDVKIDNTPPTISAVSNAVARGDNLTIRVQDNFVVDHLELSRDGVADPPIRVDPPFSFGWPWPCGPASVHIRAIDAAGGESEASFPVTSSDRADLDCDGHGMLSAGGDDCDDANASIHPGAPEVPEGYDVTCDGQVASLPGIDFDGDGVPSLSDGGADCDDTDPQTHGAFFALEHRALTVAGAPQTWSPGEAALARGGPFWELYLNRAGVIQRARPQGEDIELTQIADSANPGSIAAEGDYVAYGRGQQVEILQRTSAGYSVRAIDAGGFVGKIGLSTTFNPAGLYVVFQAGTKVWLARETGGGWGRQLLVDAQAPLAAAPEIGSFDVNVVFRTASQAWKVGPVLGGIGAMPFGPAGPTTASAAYSNIIALVAIQEGGGGTIYGGDAAEPLVFFPSPVRGIAISYPYAFVQLVGDDSVRVCLITDDFRVVQTLGGISGLETGREDSFLGGGMIHVPALDSVRAVTDMFGDGIDRNCDRSP